MKILTLKSLIFCFICLLSTCLVDSQNLEIQEQYSFKNGDPSGIGKWYLGREIAYVMGYQGISWLERPEREEEERVSVLLKNMDLKPNEVVADIGAGSGYHVFKIAPSVKLGKVYAVDIQQEMLDAMKAKMNQKSISNVVLVKGGEQSVNLPVNSIDKVLMVDVYHEFSFPYEIIMSVRTALKPNGKIYLIEYRGEDPRVPIKAVHKMTEAQAIKEMKAAGFVLEENIANLPWQHCMVFVQQK